MSSRMLVIDNSSYAMAQRKFRSIDPSLTDGGQMVEEDDGFAVMHRVTGESNLGGGRNEGHYDHNNYG